MFYMRREKEDRGFPVHQCIPKGERRGCGCACDVERKLNGASNPGAPRSEEGRFRFDPNRDLRAPSIA
jgi:hypothetical protein